MEQSAKARTRRIEIRLSEEERDRGAAAASVLGESLSDFFRHAARDRAEKVLTDQGRIALDRQEAARFLTALETPSQESVARLRELRERA